MAVSVSRFIHDEPALFQASRLFVNELVNVPDPILAVARKAKSRNAQIAWALLGSALFQDRSFSEIFRLLEALYKKFPEEKLWSLPVPKGGEIEQVVESVFGARVWSLFEHVSGIFWSVGLFVRQHPDLEAWARSRTPEEMWRDLGEIYFMGKSNPRPKACAAIYRLIAAAPLGLGVEYRDNPHLPPLPLTMGARRFLAMLGPARDAVFGDMDSSAKQALCNEYFKALAPENPYMVAHSLQFFLENGKDGFICREKTERCRKCPLYEHCNYAEHQDSRTR